MAWSTASPRESVLVWARWGWADGHSGLARATNDVTDGIRSVSSLLVADQLLVHSSREGPLGELPAYSWDPQATARGEDVPLKIDEPDALRYVVHSIAQEWRPAVTSSSPQHV
ncbi:hypothetical protein ACH4SP_36405 [Streptomyces sp. NPDC021093]|uniref:hypothetical protein n=1 Tax=Streptomyces sp. NPDC021093 TaxID=3365112 RepID=UPI0037A62128